MNTFSNITKEITTKTELVYFLDDITTAQESIFKNNGENLSNKIKGEVSEPFLKFLEKKEQEKALTSKDEQKNFLKELSDYLQSIPQAKLTLAFSPSKDFIQEISNWIEKEIGEKTILNLTINHKITGGIVIEFKGKYLDLSLAKKINKSVAQKIYE